MKRLLAFCFVLVVCIPTAMAAQVQDADMGARLNQWERQLRSLRFAIQAAEQQSLELTFRFEAQGVASYENVRYTSSADGRIIPAHMWTLLDAGERRLPALVWIHGGVHGHLAFY